MTELQTRPLSPTPSGSEGQPTAPNYRKSRRGLGVGAIIGGSALLLAGGGYGLSLIGHAPAKPKATSGSTPNATPTANPNKDSSKPEVFTAATVEIPANLDKNQLATAFVDRLTSWVSAGTDDETVYNDFLAHNGPNSDYTDKVAAKNVAIYENMFVKHDPDSPLAGEIKTIQDSNSLVLDDWLITYKSGDKADHNTPFVIKSTYDPGSAVLATSADGSTETLTFDYTSTNNAAKNRIHTEVPGQAALNGEKTYATINFTKVGDKLDISDMKFHD